MNSVTLSDVREAAERIKPHIHRTPVLTSQFFNHLSGADIYFKCENFQKVGAFKMRGAANAVFSLSDEAAAKGVATHSSGNHAAALARAAALRKIPAYVVMPENAPGIKRRAVEGYGAHVINCRPTLKAREEGLQKVVKKTGATFIHPYNNEKVIAGQGTAALELLEQMPVPPDVVAVPVGGGGLLSGTCIAVHGILPQCKIYAGEPKLADDAWQSLQAGKIIPSTNPDTIADGLKTSLGDKTFPIIYNHVEEIITVTEEEISHTMRLVWERMKIIIEPSSAVPLAAILNPGNNFTGKKIGIILSGGNVDLSNMPF